MAHEIDSGKLWPDRAREREKEKGVIERESSLSGSCLGLLMSHMPRCLGEAYEESPRQITWTCTWTCQGGRSSKRQVEGELLLTFRGLFKVGRAQKAK